MKKIPNTLKHFFLSPLSSIPYWWVFIVFVGFAYVFFMPQHPPMDWALYTNGLWSNGLDLYQDPSRINPPWGLILLLPYYWMGASGSRFFSVLVIGWLCRNRKWSLSHFLAITFNMYFIITMTKSNMDILVLVFPILLWETVRNTRWQSLGFGLSIPIFLLKPQGAIFVLMYLFWQERAHWRGLISPLFIAGLILLPISLVGSPPLFIQWIENIQNPSTTNIFYWGTNNISITAHL
ncbi:MAG: hypothetical protein N2D54_11515, partial [Chloroflexota bacterium]